MNYSIFDFGLIYDIILLLLFIAVAIDTVGLIKFIPMPLSDKKEYTEDVVQPLKLIMYTAAAAYCIYITVTGGYDSVTNGIHIFMAAILIADAAIWTFIKIKYRKT